MSRLRDNKLKSNVLFHPSIKLLDLIDSGASGTFCCEATWQMLGKPILQPVSVQYQLAEGSPLPVVGQFQSTASIDGKSPKI